MNKNIRIKIITVAFALCYCIALGESIIIDFFSGIKEGYQIGSEWIQKHETDLPTQEYPFNTINNFIEFQVKPKVINNLYPTKLETIGGTSLAVRANHFHALIENPSRPTWIQIALKISVMFVFMLLALSIFIPIQVAKVIHSIIKNEIFDERNVHRLRLIGYALLLIFAMAAGFGYIATIDARNLVQPSDYKIIFSLKEDYIYLLFGFATLLFAEILRISHKMKAENDLTI